MDLNTSWYILIGVLFGGYAVLDGFDLGAGILSLFSRDEKERSTCMSAIAPVWDGNEVWLLAGGGALFAAFPKVYAAVFSGFYLALMLVLYALILRAVSMEFSAHVHSQAAKKIWGIVFGASSLIVALLLGVAFANIMRGLPISAEGDYTGGFFGLLNPTGLIGGVVGIAFFTMHGAAYMSMKTDGALQQRMLGHGKKMAVASAVVFVLLLVMLGLQAKHLFSGGLFYWLAILVMAGGFVLSIRSASGQKSGLFFIGSALVILAYIASVAVGLYPNMALSSLDPAWSLTAYNASSTPRTLQAMLIIALVGMPVVLAYTVVIYRVFRGKASDSYYSEN